ncbi:growth-regulating factor 7 isoform X2 [Prunus avium]|uniref:Growth-regulating factor n=1 Tax=Prunus avium TaxID=42229 RepID=A0A6P5TG88_PRUAV|nr:growth-regulating factor 7 isoform X2 [Prunus avium]
MTMEEEGGGKVKLGLGIGVDCYGDDRNGTEEVVVGKKKKKYGGGGLTASQLHELEQQALIYKHFAANLPVPFHLVLPIWKSVAASFGSSNAAAIYRQYPSFVGFSALGFDYRDHEPGRCRRTDGKKWRCNKNVVPDQKYCQQHMHRGRQRSRKPVENSEVASPSSTKTPKNSEALLGCNGLYFDNGSGVELEPGRCRRTDGKKWRCRRDVLPDQKYCGQHIHRGAKRQMKDFQPVAVPSSSAAAMNTARLSQTTAICRKINCAIPNTNLSISIPANPPPGRNDERSNSSSDSDTTLTDTSLTACDSSYVSS